jgi:hypothetical protein
VAFEAAQPAGLQALAGQEQVHAEAAPGPADGDEQVEEVGPGREQLAELVHHDQQRRQRLQGLAGARVGGRVGGPPRLPVAHPVQPGPGQQALAAGQLAEQGLLHPVDQGRVPLQVGDDPGHVGQAGQVGEGGAALVVGQDEGQLVGGVPGGQAGDQGAQQLALARPGRPDDQPVRPHAALGRLGEVEHGRGAVVGHADRGGQQRRPPLARP